MRGSIVALGSSKIHNAPRNKNYSNFSQSTTGGWQEEEEGEKKEQGQGQKATKLR